MPCARTAMRVLRFVLEIALNGISKIALCPLVPTGRSCLLRRLDAGISCLFVSEGEQQASAESVVVFFIDHVEQVMHRNLLLLIVFENVGAGL